MRGYLIKQQVESLLSEGQYSHRQIARYVGVSRSVVKAIAESRSKRRVCRLRPAPCDSTPLVRCPSCGYRVTMPCVYCRAVAFRRRLGGSLFDSRESPSAKSD